MTDELANWILSEMEEAHYEEVTTLLNTVFQNVGSAQEMKRFQSAIHSLVMDDDIKIVPEHASRERVVDLERDAALKFVSELPSLFQFRTDQKYWFYVNETKRSLERRAPGFSLTENGLAKASTLLSERGYGWWKK